MDMPERLSELRIGKAAEQAGMRRPGGLAPQGLDQHDFDQAAEHRIASGPAFGRFLQDDRHKRPQSRGRPLDSRHMHESRQKPDQQVGIGRIALDEAAEDPGDRSRSFATHSYFAIHHVAGLEGVVRQFRPSIRLAEEGVRERFCREDIVSSRSETGPVSSVLNQQLPSVTK